MMGKEGPKPQQLSFAVYISALHMVLYLDCHLLCSLLYCVAATTFAAETPFAIMRNSCCTHTISKAPF